jgi:hypothetical protein
MTNPHVAEKVTPRHLRRAAYLYVRQSTLRQVLVNTGAARRALQPVAPRALEHSLDRTVADANLVGNPADAPAKDARRENRIGDLRTAPRRRAAWATTAWLSAARSPTW